MHLLHRIGRQDDGAIIAVPSSPGGLEIIALGGRNPPQAGAAAGDIDDDGGKFAPGQVGDSLLHEGNARGGRGSHGPGPGGGGAEEHVDGSDFAFRLDETALDFREFLGKEFGDIVLRGDRVAEIIPAAGFDGAAGQGFVAFYEKTFLHRKAYLHTSMTTSGHISAQRAQPVHSCSGVGSTG